MVEEERNGEGSLQEHLGSSGLAMLDPSVRTRPSAVLAGLRETGPSQQSIEEAAEETNQRDKIWAIRKSWRTYVSQIRAWGGWCQLMSYEPHFVADVEIMRKRVMHWRCVVHHGPSYTKYVAAVKWGARFLSLSTEWYDEVYKQALRGVMRSDVVPPPSRKAIQAPLLVKLVRLARRRGEHEQAVLYVLAAELLARVKSELLPLEVAGGHSEVRCESGRLRVRLSCRKPSQLPEELVRECRCSSGPSEICGVHALLGHMDTMPGGHKGRLFRTAYQPFVRLLRKHLEELSVPEYAAYASHAFRRGRARDMVDAGCTLSDLLRAGSWRSAAFLQYLDLGAIHRRMAAQLVVDNSDSD